MRGRFRKFDEKKKESLRGRQGSGFRFRLREDYKRSEKPTPRLKSQGGRELRRSWKRKDPTQKGKVISKSRTGRFQEIQERGERNTRAFIGKERGNLTVASFQKEQPLRPEERGSPKKKQQEERKDRRGTEIGGRAQGGCIC